MMICSSTQMQSVLELWQDTWWQTIANVLPLPGDEITMFAHTTQVQGNVWVAPQVWCKEDLFWIPLWIPAVLQEGDLSPRWSVLPWLPASQFDPLSASHLFREPIQVLEDYLRYEFLEQFDRDGQNNWSDFYAGCLGLLNLVGGENWEQALIAKGYTLLDKTFCVSQSTLRSAKPHIDRFTKQLDNEEVDLIVEQYASVEDAEVEDQITLTEQNKTVRFCGLIPGLASLNSQEKESLDAVLALDQGICAIDSPIGCDVEKMISAICASKIVTQTLMNKPLPQIYRLSRHPHFRETNFPFEVKYLFPKTESQIQNNIVLQCQALFLKQEVHEVETLLKHLAHQLQLQYENFLMGLNLLDKFIQERDGSEFGEKEQIQQYLIALQGQDEAYEQEFTELLERQAQMNAKRSQSLVSKLFGWVGEKDQQSSQALGERIRQVKVLRTKIHQQIVTVTDQMTVSKQAKLWQQWLADNQLDVSASVYKQDHLCALLHHAFAQSLWMIACYYRLAQEKQSQSVISLPSEKRSASPVGLQLFKWQLYPKVGWEGVPTIAENADMLIIEESNRLLPQEVAPWLAFAKQAVFFGDIRDMTPQAMMSMVEAERLILSQALEDDETQEQLHYKGMMPHSGNAFQVALINGTFALSLNSHAFFSLLDALNSMQHKRFQFHAALGESQLTNKGYKNIREAYAIVVWLQEGPYRDCPHQVQVVTPFAAQKEILESLMAEYKVNCQVVTFAELSATQWECIVFSPVYSIRDPRPFVFDQGEHFFYSLAIRALSALYVIGTPQIFDPKMHSPSGALAKMIYSDINVEVSKSQCD